MKKICYYETMIGKIGIVEENGAIVNICFNEVEGMKVEVEQTELISEAASQLEEYFRGERKSFNLPLKPEGSEFMMKVWNKIQDISYGETVSYKALAEAVGRNKAYRAVGMANNRNPIPIIIPCHRVIGINGDLVGYAGGLDIKKQLLDLESQMAVSF